ncbi:hypothetical protein [Phytomonospora endophytica]|uniref:Uncharacterized protein n=1 Tax=Phytomonospora endophytica TaxID=714109 RepID=A0A841FRA2_9ACTN|nr:hypothetical protein [Phytomonospora endophytica]MBB6039821.1 hypothetical protein [Phytomonospora endophytica]GIG70325.1 hypothetical protein Pen01_66200 [Phytomonospora endophytica]
MFTVLFWCGVGLAPVAAGTLLLGDGGGPSRTSVLLAVSSIVLIGLSIGLRSDPQIVYVELSEEVAQVRYEFGEADEAARLAIIKARTETRDLKIVVDDLCLRLMGTAQQAHDALDTHTGQQPLMRAVPATLPRRPPGPRHAAEDEPEIQLAANLEQVVSHTTERVSVTRRETTHSPTPYRNPVTYGTQASPVVPSPDPRHTRLESRSRHPHDDPAAESWIAALRADERERAREPVRREPSKFDTGQFWRGPDTGYRSPSRYAEPAPGGWRAEERSAEVHFGHRETVGEPYRDDQPYDQGRRAYPS